jgi:hypothetical protein
MTTPEPETFDGLAFVQGRKKSGSRLVTLSLTTLDSTPAAAAFIAANQGASNPKPNEHSKIK